MAVTQILLVKLDMQMLEICFGDIFCISMQATWTKSDSPSFVFYQLFLDVSHACAVFMCIFVGNDFLPPMAMLKVREGAIDLLMAIYKKEMPRIGDFLCDGPKVGAYFCTVYVTFC